MESAAPDLTLLATVQPPPYRPLVLRGATDSTGGSFRNAMAHYSRGEYAEAARRLEALAVKRNHDAGVTFYLAASRLLAGDPKSSIELFRAAGRSDSRYRDAAHFYAAKAYLKLGEAAAAERELQMAARSSGTYEREARTLLAELRKVLAR